MGLDDERWARPGGSRSAGPVPPSGLIDPALHPLPTGYRSPVTPDPTPDATAPAASEESSAASETSSASSDEDAAPAADELTVGRDPRPRPRLRKVMVRVGAGLAVLVLLLGVGVGTLQVHDAGETLTQDQLATAITSFRPGIETTDTSVQSAEELRSDQPVQADPAVCAELIDVAPVGAQGGASWFAFAGRVQTTDLQAIRFTDPGQARDALDTIRSAAHRCARVSLGDETTGTGDDGFDVVARSPESTFRHRDRVFYTLRWAGSADIEESGYREFEIYLRRFGNVLVWGIGPTAATGAPHRAAADDLTVRLRQLAKA